MIFLRIQEESHGNDEWKMCDSEKKEMKFAWYPCIDFRVRVLCIVLCMQYLQHKHDTNLIWHIASFETVDISSEYYPPPIICAFLSIFFSYDKLYAIFRWLFARANRATIPYNDIIIAIFFRFLLTFPLIVHIFRCWL